MSQAASMAASTSEIVPLLVKVSSTISTKSVQIVHEIMFLGWGSENNHLLKSLNDIYSNMHLVLGYFSMIILKFPSTTFCTIANGLWAIHGVPKGGQKEKKLSGFGAYVFGIGIPRGLILW